MPEKKKPSFLKSLRFRILIILVILGIVPSVIVAHVMVAAYESKAVAVRKQTVEKQCDILCNLLIKENYMNDSSSQDVNSKLELLSNVYDGRILLVDRDYRIIKDTYGVDEGKTLISTMVIKCFKGEEASRYNSKTQKIEMALPVKSPEVKQLQGAMLISFSSNEIAENILELEQKSLLITGIIIVLAVLLGYVLSTVLVKPFARVTKSIEDLTDGYQNEEISVPDYTETALITDAFNKMLSRMKILDESRNEFVSNVSHELKTPMTTISGFAEGILDGTIPPEKEQDALKIVVSETRRLSRLVRRMLDLSRLNALAENSITAQEQFDLVEVVSQVIISLEGKITDRNLDMDVQMPEDKLMVWGDPDSVTQVCYNLIDNAAKFAAAGTSITLRITKKDGKAYTSISNLGATIPQDELPLLFERFHKADYSRSMDRDGVGLGLYIVKTILGNLKENITVTSEDGLTTFTFTLTLA